MAYEYPSTAGTLRLAKVQGRWQLQFAGRRAGPWPSPDQAAKAAAKHQTGLPVWDREHLEASEDLVDWRPIGDSL